VSANTDAGFSIVKYVGTQTAGDTVGHGLTQKPEMIIVKNLDSGTSGHYWAVYHHKVASDPATDYLKLNDTTAATDGSDAWDDTEPTATVFSLGNGIATNDNSGGGEDHIAYCFHSVDQYSKVGSFVGNGSADGPFVYTGFRPSWLMVKKTDGAGVDGWTITDKERDPINVMDQRIQAQSSSAEAGDVDLVDFLSNGFKIRYNGQMNNQSGTTYIYMAFAENPFKYSNAR
jgi:hypothetical protein